MHTPHEAQVVFGIDPIYFAGTLFLLTYVLIVTERLNRAVIALSAACLMILGGVLTQEAAFEGVDFNTLGLLTGMMVIVGITKNSGIFQYLAIWSAKRVNADPWGILVGASANLIVAGFAERSGQPIRFLPFMLIAFPLMLLSIVVSSLYIYLRYL